ncbi:MAG: hypothetical protein RI973_375 [Bacteroidota bacterium]|jgi:uncharacterized RDD family membrane protein YckC
MASIEIRTAQNVNITYELATLRERFLSFFFDLLIFYGIYLLTLAILFNLAGALLTSWGVNFLFMMQLAGFLAYHLLSETLAEGQSWGKKIMDIKVVRLDGREPGLNDYLLRSAFLMLDFVLSLGVLGAVLIGSSLRHQRLGDLAANTTVIRTRNRLHLQLKDILKIQSLDNYQPAYPAVRQLGEKDLLLIKALLIRSESWPNAAHAEAVAKLAAQLALDLKIEAVPTDKTAFLKTLIRDYIVLTR